MKKIYTYLIFVIFLIFIVGCSENTLNNNQNIDRLESITSEEISENIDNTNIEENEIIDKYLDTTNSSYEEMSNRFFEFTNKEYNLNEEEENTIINTAKDTLKEIEIEKNEKFNLSIIEGDSTAMNNASKTLKLNINQIYGIKELTNLPLPLVTKAAVLHEVGHYYTSDTNALLNALIFDSIMTENKVMELTEDELKELIIIPEESAWDFVKKYMYAEDYKDIEKYALSTYYNNYNIVIESDEPIEYNDTFSVKLKK